VSSSVVPWQRLLTVEILQIHAHKSSLHRLPYRTYSVRVRVRVRVTLRLAVYRQSVRLGDKPFETQLNTCFHSPYITSSLTRGSVCSLQLLLALASTVILRSDSRGTNDHTLHSQIRDSPNLEGQVPVFMYIPLAESISVLPSRPQFPFRRLLRLAASLTHSVAPFVFLISSRHGPRRNNPVPTVPLLLSAHSLLRECVHRVTVQKRSLFRESSLGNGTMCHNTPALILVVPGFDCQPRSEKAWCVGMDLIH
jgi:hypothetical protein